METHLLHYGYLAVFLTIFLEVFGLPVPGETVLITASLLAAQGKFNIILIMALGFAAAVLGDNLGFLLGRRGGRPVVRRYGKYVFVTEKRLAWVDHVFKEYGGKIIVIARFVDGLRQLNGIMAGISHMDWRRFLVFNIIGGALWIGFWGFLAYRVGRSAHQFFGTTRQIEIFLAAGTLLGIVFFLVRRAVARRRGGS